MSLKRCPNATNLFIRKHKRNTPSMQKNSSKMMYYNVQYLGLYRSKIVFVLMDDRMKFTIFLRLFYTSI